MKNCREYIHYEKKRKIKRLKRKTIFMLVVVLLILFSLLKFFKIIVNPIIVSYGEIESKKLVSVSCNEAISEVANLTSYDQLISIDYDNNNKISMIRANTNNINKISNLLAQKTQENLEKNTKNGCKISLGTLSGIGFLTGRGANISFNFSPLGSVLCHFYTIFSSAGINQTNHKIFVNIEVAYSLILPFKTVTFNTDVDYLVTECVIIGEIPSTYLNIN